MAEPDFDLAVAEYGTRLAAAAYLKRARKAARAERDHHRRLAKRARSVPLPEPERPTNELRDAQMRGLRAEGLTLAQVGTVYGLTREGVRQALLRQAARS